MHIRECLDQKETGYEQLLRITKAHSHPVRFKIAEILSEQEACVCHLEHALGQRQAYASQQLAVLKNAGILRERRQGTFIFYRLSGSAIINVLNSLQLAAGTNGNDIQSIQRPDNCPCPTCK